ncbi:hypothetical protein [Streptomyces antibioticus]|uniref:hypothetical protein n=1 Tax=Streptomyces antibioticus TaxID=1890 RepID=UPI003F446C84
MSTETTVPAPAPNPVIGQRAAVQVLADLIDRHPGLPAAYTIIHEPNQYRQQVDIQMSSDEFELWREALGIQPADVVLHTTLSHTWVAADMTYDGIHMHLTGFTDPLSAAQANAPRELPAVTA